MQMTTMKSSSVRALPRSFHPSNYVHALASPQNELINDDDETTIDGPTTAAPRAPRRSKSHAEMTAVERERADAMDLRCLDLCIGMLERVNGVRLHLLPTFLPLTDHFVHADI